jgi:hypothetical protein
MKKKRRIEITAFRRTVTVSAGSSAGGPEEPAPQGRDPADAPGDDFPARPKQADLLKAALSSIDTESSPDLEHLIEVVASHDGGEDNEN